MNFTKKLIALFIIVCIGNASFAQFTTSSGNITQQAAGNVGIGIIGATSPLSLLEVKNGSVLFDGTTGATPVAGAGTRMMWVPSKSAFRAGKVAGTSWDDANIGLYSVGFGQNTTSSGIASFSSGANCIASANQAFSAGNSCTASATTAFAFGLLNTSSANLSTTFGSSLIAESLGSFVIGTYNFTSPAYSGTSIIATDPLFVIGNGSSTLRNNALTVLKNGNVLINKVTQINTNYILDVNGKIRANEIVINTTGADFVFEKNYTLMPLSLLEQKVKEEKHLPGIATAAEMQENGVGLAELNKSLLQKTEELTLYIIELNKRIELLELAVIKK